MHDDSYDAYLCRVGDQKEDLRHSNVYKPRREVAIDDDLALTALSGECLLCSTRQLLHC